MWEVTSLYLTSREANTNLTKQSTSPTKMYAARVDSMLKIGTQAQLAPTRNKSHQDGFTRANYMQYKQVGYPFCSKVMHKTIYPSA